ncbi:DUF5058 family protein [Fusibacter ferrireducens]|uniref:DUF5058 family protein n=1 Tax=Fusibacter ferrireducens TaxID=2785058 RepID=A0ABR9ZP41_9FIRM|nr:DUF5058 family protein [Fusibacter ferrireducens]MBF4692216.1 DUF5058 family protein [Fusibacter ferrireducens]
MNYLEIANSPLLYVITIIILTVLSAQAIIFYRLAQKRAKELNIDKKTIRKVVKAASITTVIPSIAIIVGLISLAPAMGVPISWARLGMAGSLMYELTGASIGAKTMGAQLGAANYTPQAFANSVWVMTIGVVPAFLYAIFFLRKYKKRVKEAVSKDTRLQNVIITTILVCVQISFVLPALFSGGSSAYAVGIAAAVMAIMTFIIVKFKAKWLREYALSTSMLMAVVVVILLNK